MQCSIFPSLGDGVKEIGGRHPDGGLTIQFSEDGCHTVWIYAKSREHLEAMAKQMLVIAQSETSTAVLSPEPPF